MKKLFWAMCFMCSSFLLHAQSVLQGKITDAQTQQPLNGASVRLAKQGTLSDESGQFSIQAAKSGTYTLSVSSVGYQALTISIALRQGYNHQDFSLQKLPLLLQPIEVKALRAGDKAPFSTTNLTRKDIDKVNLGQDLPMLLGQTPSAVVNSDAGNGVGYTGVRIRGADGSRINVTLNGLPYNDAESQGAYFVDLPDIASSISSLQIQRGVGTSTNGAGTFGASLNMSTNEVIDQPYGQINNSFGSFNTWKNTVRAGSGLINDHFTIDARLSRVSSDGFIDRASSDLKSLYLSGAYITDKSSIRFNLLTGKEKTYQAWNGIPEAKLFNNAGGLQEHYNNNIGSLYYTSQDSANLFNSDPRKYNYFTYKDQTDNYQQDHYQLFFNHTFNKAWSMNAASFFTRGRGYYAEYKPQQAYADYGVSNPVYGVDTLAITDLVRQRWLDNRFYGGIFSVQYTTSNDQVILGGGWDRYEGKHYGNVTWAQMGGFPNDDYQYYFNKANKTDWNTYAKWQHTFSTHWSSFADLQLRHVEYNINGFDENPNLKIGNTYNFFNPKAGISYTGSKGWNGFLSGALTHKEPNRDDFEAGLENQPKSEQLLDIEANVGKKSHLFSWSGTFYYMRYKDQLVLTGKINDVGAYTRTNIPQSYRVGIELQAVVKPANWFDASFNFSLSRNKVKNFSEYIDNYDDNSQILNQYHSTDIAFSPDKVGGATLNFIPVHGLTLSLISKYVSRQFLDNTSNEKRSLTAYYTQDARISWTIHQPLVKQLQIIAAVYNVFNKKYEANGYTYSYIYDSKTITENFYFPMAGTNVLVGINIDL